MDNQYKKLNTEHATSGISMQIIPTSQLYQKIDNSQIYDGNTALRQNNVVFPPKKPNKQKTINMIFFARIVIRVNIVTVLSRKKALTSPLSGYDVSLNFSDLSQCVQRNVI